MMFLTSMFLSHPPLSCSLKSIKNISLDEEFFFFKWELKKRKEKNLAVKTPLGLPILFCEVYCFVYNWSEVWFWTLPIWILLKIQVVSLIGKDTGTVIRCLFSIGPLGLPRVWNGSICVGMRGAPLQSLSACVWMNWGISGYSLRSCVLGEHRWYDLYQLTLILVSSNLSAQLVYSIFFQEIQGIQSNKCQSFAFLIVWFEHGEMLFYCQPILVEHFLNSLPALSWPSLGGGRWITTTWSAGLTFIFLVIISTQYFLFSLALFFSFFNDRSHCLTLSSMAILPCFQGDADISRLAHGYNLGDAAYYWW